MEGLVLGGLKEESEGFDLPTADEPSVPFPRLVVRLKCGGIKYHFYIWIF